MNLLAYLSIALAGMVWLSLARPGLAKETGGGNEIRVALYADLGATKKDLPEVELCLLPSMGLTWSGSPRPTFAAENWPNSTC